MSIVPPASATLVWAFPTPFEEVRCFVWEHSPAGWSIAIMFGNETLALEVAPTRWAMEAGVDMVWRGLLSSGIGKIGRASKVLAAMSAPRPEAGTPVDAARPRRFEDPFLADRSSTAQPSGHAAPTSAGASKNCPHTPFRHREPSFDADGEPADPSPRRRPH